MDIIIYTQKRSKMQNRNYQRPATSFQRTPVQPVIVVQRQPTITVAQLENALSDNHTATELLDHVLNDTPLPVLARTASIMPEPVVFNVEHKITHDKKFTEIWGFAQDIMRTIPNAVKYNVVATDQNFNSGRQKFICSFYNKNHDLLERHLAMSLFSKKNGKQYYSIMLDVMHE
jgi:hypothetical protein